MTDLIDAVPYIIIAFVAIGILSRGVRTIRPTERAVVERLGKYKRFKDSGLTFVIPFVEKLYMLNITEQMTEIDQQEIITKDNLNAVVSAQIYHKIKTDEVSLKNAFYNVYNVNAQIVSLAQTTMRNVIGGKSFMEVNSGRQLLNDEIKSQIERQIQDWGMEIVRVELKEIIPPKDVQDTMNAVIQAQNVKQKAKDLADAAVMEADGKKNAAIKMAEGQRESQRLNAEGEAAAIEAVAAANAKQITIIAEAEAKKIKTVQTAIKENFTENAILYKQMDVSENALANNTKIILTDKNSPAPVILLGGDSNNVMPIPSGLLNRRKDPQN